MSQKVMFSIADLEKVLCVPESVYIDRISVKEDPHALIVYVTDAYETVEHSDSERHFARVDVSVNPDGFAEVEWDLE